MRKFNIRGKAQKDLLSIGRYTEKQWGKKQRDRYLKEIDSKFPLLAEKPNLGKPCDYIRQGYIKYKVRKHIIFYRKINSKIEIIRILHEKMDVERHLG